MVLCATFVTKLYLRHLMRTLGRSKRIVVAIRISYCFGRRLFYYESTHPSPLVLRISFPIKVEQEKGYQRSAWHCSWCYRSDHRNVEALRSTSSHSEWVYIHSGSEYEKMRHASFKSMTEFDRGENERERDRRWNRSGKVEPKTKKWIKGHGDVLVLKLNRWYSTTSQGNINYELWFESRWEHSTSFFSTTLLFRISTDARWKGMFGRKRTSFIR